MQKKQENTCCRFEERERNSYDETNDLPAMQRGNEPTACKSGMDVKQVVSVIDGNNQTGSPTLSIPVHPSQDNGHVGLA